MVEINTSNGNGEWRTLLHATEILALVLFIGAGIGYYFWGGSGRVVYEKPVGSGAATPVPLGGSSAPVPQSVSEKFIIQDNTPPQTAAQIEAAKQAVASAPETLKAPVAFKSFDYDAAKGKVISISGFCRDKYYALLVFSSATDYRKDPVSARVNSAYDCPVSGKFTIDLDLKLFNLTTGSYYLFVADQGATGTWYNPR